MLVNELWLLLDGGEDDHRLMAPRTHPLDPMDRTSHKVMSTLTPPYLNHVHQSHLHLCVPVNRQ